MEKAIKQILGIPEYMEIAYTCRLGYPKEPTTYLRVRRDIEDFVHHNKLGNRGLRNPALPSYTIFR